MFSVHVPRARVVRLLRAILKLSLPQTKKKKKKQKFKKGDVPSKVARVLRLCLRGAPLYTRLRWGPSV